MSLVLVVDGVRDEGLLLREAVNRERAREKRYVASESPRLDRSVVSRIDGTQPDHQSPNDKYLS